MGRVPPLVVPLLVLLLAGCGSAAPEEGCDQGQSVSNECDDQGVGMDE